MGETRSDESKPSESGAGRSQDQSARAARGDLNSDLRSANAKAGGEGGHSTSDRSTTNAAPDSTRGGSGHGARGSLNEAPKPGEGKAAQSDKQPSVANGGAKDQRSDKDIVKELEQRTGKSYGDLVLGLQRGPVDMKPRELEKTLESNGTLRHRIEDHTPPKVIDNVTVPHPYQERRYVTEGRVGTEQQIDNAQKAGRDEVRKEFLSGMVKGLAGGAKSTESVKPLGEGRHTDSGATKSATTNPRDNTHIEPPK